MELVERFKWDLASDGDLRFTLTLGDVQQSGHLICVSSVEKGSLRIKMRARCNAFVEGNINWRKECVPFI